MSWKLEQHGGVGEKFEMTGSYWIVNQLDQLDLDWINWINWINWIVLDQLDRVFLVFTGKKVIFLNLGKFSSFSSFPLSLLRSFSSFPSLSASQPLVTRSIGPN